MPDTPEGELVSTKPLALRPDVNPADAFGTSLNNYREYSSRLSRFYSSDREGAHDITGFESISSLIATLPGELKELGLSCASIGVGKDRSDPHMLEEHDIHLLDKKDGKEVVFKTGGGMLHVQIVDTTKKEQRDSPVLLYSITLPLANLRSLYFKIPQVREAMIEDDPNRYWEPKKADKFPSKLDKDHTLLSGVNAMKRLGAFSTIDYSPAKPENLGDAKQSIGFMRTLHEVQEIISQRLPSPDAVKKVLTEKQNAVDLKNERENSHPGTNSGYN